MPARICIPVCVSRADELAPACERATPFADWLEIRLDYLPESDIAPALRQLKQSPRPLILTRRIREQGGHDPQFGAADAHKFWRDMAPQIPPGALCDVEGEWLSASESPPLPPASVIASHHDFDGAPDNLDEIYERLAATGAAVLKIAVTARDITDCLPVFRLLERARRENRSLIALAMSEAGVVTRVLGPAWGSFLTFAALDDAQRTAPGQLRADELRGLYRVDDITHATPVYGLLGWPVGHSLSPTMHNKALAACGLEGVYLPLAARDAGEFMRQMARGFDWNLRGLSVTAPHKQTVIPHLDWLSPAARDIGAVNTIVFADDGQLRGHNTDAEGFLTPLRAALGDVKGAHCAVLGAGGAARAVVWALRGAGAEVTILARDEGKARVLADEFGVASGALTDEALTGFEVVVNATPLGTRGALENETPAVAAQLRGVRLAYDLVYNPPQTPFLREARAAGCQTLGGLPMLVHQAAAQFRLWTNRTAPFEIMQRAAEEAIL
jgi:3-dehydroquinate dehydratase/shikimate dehydrogenase